jgi:hypothetical protein
LFLFITIFSNFRVTKQLYILAHSIKSAYFFHQWLILNYILDFQKVKQEDWNFLFNITNQFLLIQAFIIFILINLQVLNPLNILLFLRIQFFWLVSDPHLSHQVANMRHILSHNSNLFFLEAYWYIKII